MRRLAAIVVVAAQMAAWAVEPEWTPGLWPVQKGVYTNAIAQDLSDAVWSRMMWIGSNYYERIDYSTNQFTHARAEEMTATLDSIYKQFLFTNYADTGQVTFDGWFSNAVTTNLQADFPTNNNKANMFKFVGAGAVFVETTNKLCGGVMEERYGITAQKALWTKRKGRPNPLVVREWVYNPALNPSLSWWTQGRFPDPWYNNELMLSKSCLPFLSPEQYPVFRYTPGGSNEFVPGSLHFATDPHDEAYWTTNNSSLGFLTFGSHEQTLLTTNDRATRPLVAFIERSGFSAATPPPNTNDRVTLYWDHPSITTYQGHVVWDYTLLKEQLNEHQLVISHLYLTPWKNWQWTNTLYYTNGATYHELEGCPTVSTNGSGNYTNGNNTVDHSFDIELLNLWWWRENPYEWPDWPTNPLPVIFEDMPWIATETDHQMAPFHNMTNSYSIELKQHADFDHYPGESSIAWSAYRADTVTVTVAGSYATAEMMVGPLWTGTYHRVHIYQRDVYSPSSNPHPYYVRVYVSDPVTNEWVISDRLSVSNKIAIPPLVLSGETDGPYEHEYLSSYYYYYLWYEDETGCHYTNENITVEPYEIVQPCEDPPPGPAGGGLLHVETEQTWTYSHDSEQKVANRAEFRVMIEWIP